MPEWNNPAAVQSIHSWLEAGALLFFAVLVVFDVASHLALSKKNERKLDRIGLVSFAIAVLMEIAAYPYGKRNDDLSQKKIAELNAKAGKARQEAEEAGERAAKVGESNDLLSVDLEREKQRTARFQKEAIDEQIALTDLVSAQGPRARLLTKAAPELARQLARFAGQRVGLFICGQQAVAEQETIDTWGAIANILGSDTVDGITGAKWKEVPTNLNWARNCGAAKGLGQGVKVFVSKRASKNTMLAATILARGLDKVLPRSEDKMLASIDPDFTRLEVEHGSFRKDSPWTAPAFDAELITVLIGEHP